MPYLEMEAIRKDYPDFSLEVSLQCERGASVAILGPSGGGKSTLLRLIAGLIAPDRGRIVLDGRDITGLPARRRGVGLVFQDFALFPHYDVAGNIAYGLRARHPEGDARTRAVQVEALLDRFALEGFGGRQIDGLSGGESQRVALARALAVSPGLMLFDEPLGSLDATLRKELREELRSLQREHGYTSISVTHDQEDALAIADHIVVMRHGRVVQTGSPETLYRHPRSAFVAAFFGDANLVSGRELEAMFQVPSKPGLYCIRAEQLRPAGARFPGPALDLVVSDIEFRGRDHLVKGRPALAATLGPTLCFRMAERPVLGAVVRVAWPEEPLEAIVDDRDGRPGTGAVQRPNKKPGRPT
jgi:ABC-type Fe3+/spermidine/putrescine transport system ATPase subunit